MTARLNHTLVAARDRDASALFLSEMLGLPAPLELGPFAVVPVGDRLTLDFVERKGDVVSQHYAFLVDETEFDEIFDRIRERNLQYWADPFRREPNSINHWDDGRGVYFEDPNGHLLEIITRPYGSAGTEAEHPHPLIASKIEAKTDAEKHRGTTPELRNDENRGAHPPGAERPWVIRPNAVD
jgi:catechol 2,3-dioxygenase-like lactoylglutathione lyase family enzyme